MLSIFSIEVLAIVEYTFEGTCMITQISVVNGFYEWFPRAVLIICLALCFSWASSVHNDLHEAKFYKLEGKSLFGNLTERHLTQDFLDCSFLCVKSATKNCFSFNFGGAERQGLYECELSNSEKKFNPKNLQERQGFSYYGMKEEARELN